MTFLDLTEKNLNVYDQVLIANSFKEHGNWVHPFIKGYKTIPIITKSVNKWGYIGPYELKTKENWIFENYWQFSKVYKYTPNVKINQYGKLIWNYSFTSFIDKDENVNDNYWKWRKTGFNHRIPVRYPVYRKNVSKCLYAIPEFDKTRKLDYIQARKEIYMKEYIKCLEGNELFEELKEMYDSGEKLLLSEVDGFHSKNAEFYKKKYKELSNEPLEYSIINATETNLKIKINESIDPAGHVYPIVMKLKGNYTKLI